MPERMSALDSSFLVIEKRNRPMHVGALIMLKPGRDGFDVRRTVELAQERIHLIPRYRQKVRFVPGHLANPVWVDDPQFDLSYHLQHVSLPRPGRMEQLWELAGRIFSRSLDRSRPLWEFYLLDGMEDGSVALLMKTHHCMVDGVSAVEMLTALVDLQPEPRRMEPEPWHPDPEPSDAELLRSGIFERAAQPLQMATSMRDWVGNLSETGRKAVGTAMGLASTGKRMPTGLASTPLTTPSTEWRRFRGLQQPLADYKALRRAFDCTVNDVVMAVVCGALRNWLLSRGEEVSPDMTIRVMAPVSMRRPEEMGSGGNLVSGMFIDIPVGLAEPAERIADIRRQTQAIKDAGEAVSVGALMPATDFIAPNLFAIAVRLGVKADMLHTVVTNVPGPQFPLYMNGAEITALYPFLTTFPNRALTHGVMSYNGEMCWGLIGERDAMYDLAAYAEFLDGALQELLLVDETTAEEA